MVRERPFTRNSLQLDEKSTADKAENESGNFGSSAEFCTSAGQFDDLLKAEFIKLVRGTVRPG
jgi:hypothetical protein